MTRLQRMKIARGRRRWFWRMRRTGFLRPIYLPIVDETACITVDDRCRLLRERLSAIKFTRTHVYTNPHEDFVNESMLICDYALILHRERANMKRRRIAGPIGAGKPRVTAAESLALSCGRLYGHDVAADVNKEFTDAAAR